MTVQQLAAHYAVSDDTVRGWVREKIIQPYYLPIARKQHKQGAKTYNTIRFKRIDAMELARKKPWEGS